MATVAAATTTTQTTTAAIKPGSRPSEGVLGPVPVPVPLLSEPSSPVVVVRGGYGGMIGPSFPPVLLVTTWAVDAATVFVVVVASAKVVVVVVTTASAEVAGGADSDDSVSETLPFGVSICGVVSGPATTTNRLVLEPTLQTQNSADAMCGRSKTTHTLCLATHARTVVIGVEAGAVPAVALKQVVQDAAAHVHIGTDLVTRRPIVCVPSTIQFNNNKLIDHLI